MRICAKRWRFVFVTGAGISPLENSDLETDPQSVIAVVRAENYILLFQLRLSPSFSVKVPNYKNKKFRLVYRNPRETLSKWRILYDQKGEEWRTQNCLIFQNSLFVILNCGRASGEGGGECTWAALWYCWEQDLPSLPHFGFWGSALLEAGIILGPPNWKIITRLMITVTFTQLQLPGYMLIGTLWDRNEFGSSFASWSTRGKNW